MPEKVEKRRNFLINILFLAAVLALVYVFFKYLFWVTAPFLLTFLFAIILQKPLRYLDKRTNKKFHTLWSILLVFLSIVIIIVPLGLLATALISKVSDLIKYFVNEMRDLPSFLSTLENEILNLGRRLPDSVYPAFSEKVSETFTRLIEDFDFSSIGINMNTITNGVSSGITGVYSVIKNVPSVMLGVVIAIIAWIFFTKDYNRIVRFIQLQLPEGKKNTLVEIKQVFSKTVLKMFRAYGLIMAITFGELFISFSILSMTKIMNNSNYPWIALGIAIFDIMPVAGSGGILIPWSLFSLVMGNYKQAIAIIVIYALITVVRQYIEPKIVGDTLGVHPLITLMGLYFGLKLFGFLGMFIVPITVMTLKAFNDTGRIQLWKTPDRN